MSETTSRVDRAELARRVERAGKLLQKGKTAEALEEYLQVLRDDPENDVVRQLSADLCLSLKRNPEAVKLLGELFERQVKAGDATRASLTYKKLERHGTPTWEQKFRFGELLEGSNKKLAVGTYEAALAELAKLGNHQQTLDVLARLVTLEPVPANFLRIAEVSAQLGDRRAAALAYQRVGQLTEATGGDATQWWERAYQEDSSDPEIALTYGKSLLSQGQAGAAIFILEPQMHASNPTPEMKEAYLQALLAAGRHAEAHPLLWEAFERNPARMQQVVKLIGQLLDGEDDEAALVLARKLEAFQRRRGERRQFVSTMQEITSQHRVSARVLEFMAELYNGSSRENEYFQTLLRLFDLYVGSGEFAKAIEALDRAIDVDPYESSHARRLDALKGKVDDARHKAVGLRLTSSGKPPEEPARSADSAMGSSTLQDLMLQAEILVQYGMRNKAMERLQRIQELFPHEEEQNEELQRLYMSAGFTPKYAGSAVQPTATKAALAATSVPAPTTVPAADPAAEVRSFTRVAEITRKLYHQTNATAVLTTAAREIGIHWGTTRCIAAMCKPGQPATAVEQYCADGVTTADAAALEAVLSSLQGAAIGGDPVAIHDASNSVELEPARKAVSELGVKSVLMVPLGDGVEPVGMLLLIQNIACDWSPADMVVLKTLADQAVIALNNVGLRRLVKNLSVTDEKSGLLKRASYLDLLLAESKRALQNGSALSVLLVQFGRSASMVKEYGEAGLEQSMEKIGQIFSANIRSNDLAFRYDTTTIAILLGETAEKEGILAVEKLRRVISEVKLRKEGSDQAQPAHFAAGLAEAVVRPGYDAVDIVTEVINRAELALASAMSQGPGKVVALNAERAAGAVA